jgi:hypothetical protein
MLVTSTACLLLGFKRGFEGHGAAAESCCDSSIGHGCAEQQLSQWPADVVLFPAWFL